MAAETSLDAKVPVFLALSKLNFCHLVNYYYTVRTVDKFNAYYILLLIVIYYVFQNFLSFMSILSNDVAAPMGFNWDLYLIAVLFALLSYIIYLRRPNRQPPNV
jgi:hypothetical protein